MEENVRERDRLREQPRDGKNTSPFLERARESERVFSRVFEGEKQREAFEMALRVWSFQVNARSRVKKLFALPREGFFSL